MSRPLAVPECPNCLTPLEPDAESPGALACPVCRFMQLPCPDCGAEMWKQVEAPPDLAIEAGGLPLERCAVVWVCRNPDCGRRLEAEL